MDLTLTPPGGTAADDAIATWSCDGITVQLLAGETGGLHVRELRALGDVTAAVLQVVLFEGPRDTAQQLADDLSDRRIWPAVADLPGLAGAVVAVAADGGRAVVTFADRPEVFGAALERIFATELLPEEDPALLTGPSSVAVHPITHATHTLRDLSTVATA